ncbi:MAG: restriction endonuclease subunit S [Bacteroidales bacterium]|nr:restriction endonuclease subunit S [Bacteroidales bacterium]
METIIKRISELGEVVGGGTPSTAIDEYWNGDIPWISPKDLTGYTAVYIANGESFITSKGLNKSGTRLLPKNTVLFSSRAPIGYIALAANPICTNQGFKSIVCNEDIVNPLFLYYYLKANLSYIRLFGTGATFPEISGSAMRKIKLQVFKDVRYQKRVADILFQFDALIENNNTRIGLMEKMARGLYKEWFVRFRYPGHEKDSLVASKLGKTPSSFDLAQMNEVFDYYIGGGWGNDIPSEDYPVEASVIRGADFPGVWRYDVSSCPVRYHKASNYKSRKLEDGDIVMEISGGTAEQPVGRTVLVTQDMIDRFKDGTVICASFCKLIRLKKKKISPYYFYFWMHYLYDTRIIDRFQLQSTGIINFKFESFLRKGLVMLPPKTVMDAFDNEVAPIFKEMNVLAQQNDLLIKQRDLLLPRLMSGKLEVNI